MPKHKHRLTLADLRKGASASKSSGAQTLQMLYADNKPETEGLRQLRKDTERGALINSKKITGYGNWTDPMGGYNDILKNEAGLNDKQLMQVNSSYSQNLMSLMTSPLLFNEKIGIVSDNEIKPIGYTSNIYKGDDSEIYFQATLQGYQSKKALGNRKEGPDAKPEFLQAPVEVLYKLEGDKFVLQYIETNSDFVRDVFLGNHDQLEERFNRELKAPATLKEIGDILVIHPPCNDKIQNVYLAAMQTVCSYEQQKISAQELETALKQLMPMLEETKKSEKRMSFVRRHSIIGQKPEKNNSELAIENLEKVIAKVADLPGYIAAPVSKEAVARRSTVVSNDSVMDKPTEAQPSMSIRKA